MSRFTLTFKTPDITNCLTEEELAVAKKYVEYGEYVTIEFDSETGDARVLEK